jgi:NAD(P)-dependent dehydrogenase (short-subunit alcohol dehydrogenase family)
MAVQTKGCKGEIHAIQCDISKEEDVVRVIKWTRDNLGGADVLVNNAGAVIRSMFKGVIIKFI